MMWCNDVITEVLFSIKQKEIQWYYYIVFYFYFKCNIKRLTSNKRIIILIVIACLIGTITTD